MTERKYPVRDSGPMYNFPMPTETLRDQLAEAQAKIDAALRLHTPVIVEKLSRPQCKASHGVAWVPWPCDTAKALGVTE